MVFKNLRKGCILVSAVCLSVSWPVCSFAESDTGHQTEPVTVTSTVAQPSGYNTDTQQNVHRPTDPVTTTSTVSENAPPAPGPETTTTTAPAGVSSKTQVIEKTASMNINDHVVMISGSISTGYLNGMSKETVYDPENNHRNSELDWELQQVFMVGAGVSIKPLSWLRFNGNIWFKVNDGNGSMDDYDWMLYDYSDWTDWSHSSVNVTEGLIYDINAELTVLHYEEASLFGIIGFRHDHWKWDAKGGNYIYSNYYLYDSVGTFPDVTVGTYEQTYDVPYFGIGFHANMDPVTLTGRIYGSPWVSSSDTDHHVLRDLIITSSINGGRMYGVDLALTYNFTQHIAATAAVQYVDYQELKGTKDWNFFSDGEQFTYRGGLSNESTLVSLSLLWTL